MTYATLAAVFKRADRKGVRMEGERWMDIRSDRQKGNELYRNSKEVDILLNMDEKDREILEAEPDEIDMAPKEKVRKFAR